MIETPYQQEFWNEEAPTARFSHPLNQQWLERIVLHDSPILDYGCGYGRTLGKLSRLGYENLTGLDTSEAMLERARSTVSKARFVQVAGPPTPLPDTSFDLILLLAVLTSIPASEHQRAVIGDAFRLLRLGGYLYVSDLPLQTDTRRVARYRNAQPDGLPYGTFEFAGGRAIMRHHAEEWFDDLFSAFKEVERKTTRVATMRGRRADAVQYLLQKPIP